MSRSGVIGLEVIGAPKRECGSCTACCTVMGVEELGKPYYTKCEHECSSGCGIYGKHPDLCKQFKCLWREGLSGSLADRPDKVGLFLVPTLLVGHKVIMEYHFGDKIPSAAAGRRIFGGQLADFMNERGFHGIVIHTSPPPMLYPAKAPYTQNWRDGDSVWYVPSKVLGPGYLVQVPHDKFDQSKQYAEDML